MKQVEGHHRQATEGLEAVVGSLQEEMRQLHALMGMIQRQSDEVSREMDVKQKENLTLLHRQHEMQVRLSERDVSPRLLEMNF